MTEPARFQVPGATMKSTDALRMGNAAISALTR